MTYAWASIPRAKASTYFIGIVYHRVRGLSSTFLVFFEFIANGEVSECECESDKEHEYTVSDKRESV